MIAAPGAWRLTTAETRNVSGEGCGHLRQASLPERGRGEGALRRPF